MASLLGFSPSQWRPRFTSHRIFQENPGRVPTQSSDILAICFSRDRAMQLDALLASWGQHVAPPHPLIVLVGTSGERHLRAYREVEELHQSRLITFVYEDECGGFRTALLRQLAGAIQRVVYFLVDDMLFVRPLQIEVLASYVSPHCVPAMRLGASLTRTETVSYQSLPFFWRPRDPSLDLSPYLFWRWSQGKLAWNYPLAVDGNLFQLSEMHRILETFPFRSPSSLEVGLQTWRRRFVRRVGMCPLLPSTVNIPHNRVQTEVANVFGSHHQDKLLDWWCEGRRIDWAAYANMNVISTHEQMHVSLLHRGSA